ncbi:hypothetical protein [Azospirillum brasilense]|uniref:O-antigen ligase domain-containing protein n=1 Tax=Azospirillum brasilense TaxID=192 RepID=A0A6L3AY47_AZOBR|nr:hypothetical protein [Azospirillum brasilense]KAA0684622.1 hypothetical protein DS837_16420 [Azospirillum brasilense]
MGEGEGAQWRAAGLFLALVFYGLLSAPAPAEVRPAEAMIGALLVLGIGLWRPLSVATGQTLLEGDSPPWETPAVLALAVLLWCPLMRGVWLDWALGDMVRDVVPLLYLFLPVLLVPLLRAAPDWAVGLLAGGLAVAGVGFALRWWKQVDWGFGAVGVRAMADGGVYLLNAPSVLFAAIALPAFGVGMLRRGGWLRRVAGVAAVLSGLLCLVALAGAVHRMALGLAATAFAALALWWLRRAPLAVLGAAGTALLIVTLFPEALLGALGQVAEKTRLAGANARWEEAEAALGQALSSPAAFLFGQGWGALLVNPAVGGWRVSYTHTLVTYALAKTGVVGLCALIVYLGALAPRVLALLRSDPALGWAVSAPLVMALGVHTSFKYLDTGLLLTLAALAVERGKRLPTR